MDTINVNINIDNNTNKMQAKSDSPVTYVSHSLWSRYEKGRWAKYTPAREHTRLKIASLNSENPRKKRAVTLGYGTGEVEWSVTTAARKKSAFPANTASTPPLQSRSMA